MSRAWLRPLLPPLLAVAQAVLLGALLVGLAGVDPARAGAALVAGAFGDWLALENTLTRMGPLVLIGLGVAIAFRSGVWNIGGEGQLYVGALAATALATRLAPTGVALVQLPLVILGGALAGAAWAGVAAALRIRRGVSEVLSTILLNFIATLAVAYAVHGPLQELGRGYPQSDALPEAARLAAIPGMVRAHAGLLAAALLPAFVWALLFRTAAGLRLRAVGLAPEAARYAGISPERETVRALILSGGLAGLAGSLEVTGVTGRLFENLSPGYGFTAIAVALLARLHPLAVIPSALLFAALATGSGAMQRAAGVPSTIVQVVEGLVILFSVGFALPRAGAAPS